MKINSVDLAQRIKSLTSYTNEEHIFAAVMMFEVFTDIPEEKLDETSLMELRNSILEMQGESEQKMLWLMQQIFYYHPCMHCVAVVARKCMRMGLYDLCDFYFLPVYRDFIQVQGKVFHA